MASQVVGAFLFRPAAAFACPNTIGTLYTASSSLSPPSVRGTITPGTYAVASGACDDTDFDDVAQGREKDDVDENEKELDEEEEDDAEL